MFKCDPVEVAAEGAVLPHMMHLAVGRLYHEGYELRLDTRGYLNNAVRRAVLAHPGNEVKIARAADRMATDLMRNTSFDDSKLALLAISYFALKLVDEGLVHDPQAQEILVAMMVVADAEPDENPEMAAMVKKAKEKAGDMFSEALRMGMYNFARLGD